MKIYRIKLILVVLSLLLVINGGAYANSHNDRNDDNLNNDYFEKFNRPAFQFNNFLDKVLLLPLSLVYRDFVPESFKVPIEGVLGQFQYPISGVNYILQGELEKSLLAFKKVTINLILTSGFGHITLDEEKKQPYIPTSFSQTLKQNGIDLQIYLVLPLLGGKTIRQHTGDFVDGYFICCFRKPPEFTLVEKTVIRSKYINVLQTMEDTSLDYYSAVRNITMQMENADHSNNKPKGNFEDFDFSTEELD